MRNRGLEGIDLTLDEDFTRKSGNKVSVLGLRKVIYSNRIPWLSKSKHKNKSNLTDFEIKTNFATGYVTEVKNKQFMLRLSRNHEGKESMCVRCGSPYFIHFSGLCNTCEVEMKNEYSKDKAIKELERGTGG